MDHGKGNMKRVLLVIYTHFEEPLKSAGFDKGNVDDLLEERDAIIECAVNTLNPSRASYLVQTFQLLDEEEVAPSLF